MKTKTKRPAGQVALPFGNVKKKAKKKAVKKRARGVGGQSRIDSDARRTGGKKKARKKVPAAVDATHTWHRIPVKDSTTFAEIKAAMRDLVKEGVICPCCELPAKVYKRKLNSSMAYVLLLMLGEYELNGGAFMHVPSMINRKRLKPKVAAALRGDYAKLRYWSLIEPEKIPKKIQGEDKHKKTSGNWRPTWRGIQFAKGEIEVPSHAIVYGKRCMRLTETVTSVRDTLGDKWDYNELMAGVW